MSGKPAVFTPSQLIPGMQEALILAKTGEAMRAWIPANLACENIPEGPQGMLVFDFGLLNSL